MKHKIIGEERSVVIYQRKYSIEQVVSLNIPFDEVIEIKEEIPVTIPFEELIKIVLPPVEDPFLYEGYDLDTEQVKRINELSEQKIIFSPPEYCVLECTGIYDWSKKTDENN